jgi:hypothetical protein
VIAILIHGEAPGAKAESKKKTSPVARICRKVFGELLAWNIAIAVAAATFDLSIKKIKAYKKLMRVE